MLKKVSKFVKENFKLVIVLCIGFMLASTGVYAANTIYSKNVTYDNSNSGLSSVNVQDALDETYTKCFPNTISNVISSNAELDTNIDFDMASGDDNGNGVYIRSGTENTANPIYYYRGAVDNNNLIFANFCWKIVRTTETGRTKLIYNGVPSNGTCNNTGEDSQIGTKVFNSNHDSPAYVGYMYGVPYKLQYKSMSGNTGTYYYGNDVTYSNGKYTLTDTISSSSWSGIYNGGLNNNHYTCMGGTTCTSVYYIFTTEQGTMYYITLTGGKTVEDALNGMFDNNPNITSSTIKGNSTTSGTLDYWYYNNIEQKGYSSYVEDTVWCNDRSIYQLNGWDPEGASQLLSDEALFYLYTGRTWWTMSPVGQNNYGSTKIFTVFSNGDISNDIPNSNLGIRPSISLKYNVEIDGGDGTENNPYIVE